MSESESRVTVPIRPLRFWSASILSGIALGYYFEGHTLLSPQTIVSSIPSLTFQHNPFAIAYVTRSLTSNGIVAVALIGLGLWFNFNAKKQFKLHNTPTPHGEKINSLITTGVFSVSRYCNLFKSNEISLGFLRVDKCIPILINMLNENSIDLVY